MNETAPASTEPKLANPTAASTPEAFGASPIWAVVDVLGHQRYIGRMSEITFAGAGFIRVDVPPRTDDPTSGFVKVIGPSSIYAISPVTEEVARRLRDYSHQKPIEQSLLPSPAIIRDDDDFDDEDPECF